MKNSEKFWDRLAYRYDKLNSRYEAQYRDSIDTTKGYLDQGYTILDYACGTGTCAMELAASVKQIVAIDTSEHMLEMARIKSIEQRGRNIVFDSTDLLHPYYDRMRFDVVLVFNALHFIRNVDDILERIHGLLSPGGLFISVTDCLGEEMTPGSILKKGLSGIGLLPYMKYYSMAKLEESIQQHGFEITETRNLHPQPPNFLIVAKKTNT